MRKTIGNLLIALNALLLVFVLFGDRMSFPPLLQSVGRIHPLLLHVPIGAIVFAIIFIFLGKKTKWLIGIGAVTAALASIMGIILSKEGGYAENTLALHKYSGAIFSFVLAAAWFISNRVLISASFILVLIAGHFGSILTHGDDFVLEPLFSKSKELKTISDSTSMYFAVIQPMFDERCTGCHSEKKSKGDLNLASLNGIAKGGEHGSVWLPGSPQASLLMKRILLPESHEDHMPPKGKAQLSAAEVQLLFQWILSGADTAKAWTRYSPSDSVRKLAEQFINANKAGASTTHYTFEAASKETIDKLNDPYRVVTPIAQDEPALAATFFIRDQFKPARLEELLSVKEQLVSLNLSKMPVTDAECEIIKKFENLEKLNLNFSSVTARGLKTLSSLKNLKSISLTGVNLDAAGIAELKDFKQIYTWDTTTFKQETLKLTPPVPTTDNTLIDANEKVTLTHKLPGIIIRYTTDGSDPDSTTAQVFDQPIDIKGYTILKTRACKDGWFCSPVGTYVLYKKGVMPVETKLLSKPAKGYFGEGASTFTNNKKGYVDDHRDIAWIGFRDQPLSAAFRFATGTNIRNITMCYDHNLDSWLFPPSSIEIWAGKDEAHLNLVKQLKPEVPSKKDERRNAAIVIPVEGNYEFYKIIATPLPELPKWHPSNNKDTKDKRAWLFVDEIIFGE